MNDIEFLQKVGNEVCEGCGPNADCEYAGNPEECFRIENALDILSEYLAEEND